MSIFGSVPNFDYKVDEWSVHKAQIKNFFLANDITETTDLSGNKRRAILLNCMSQDSYRLTRDLLFPETPETAAYVTIIKTLDAHFKPKKCLYAEREKFYAAVKDSQESITEYAARLRGLAAECKFGTSLEMCLTDKFVLGLDSSVIREKLYRENATELKMNAALEIACAVESAQRIANSSKVIIKSEPLLYTGSRSAAEGRPRTARGDAPSRCSVCGAKSHDAAGCGYRHLACDVCGVKGHLKRMCSSKNSGSASRYRNQRKGWRNNNYMCEDECSDSEDLVAVNNVRCSDNEPMSVEVVCGPTAGGRAVALGMEVDSGSAVSVLPAAVWREYFSHTMGQLGKANKTLRTYNGSVVSPIGTCTLPVTYNHITHNLIFYVVEKGPVSLLGRDFLAKFNLGLVSLNYCSLKQSDKLLDKYKALFSGNLGTFNKYKLSLNLKDGAKPKFCKARPVPFALKEKVGNELDRLVRVGILKPVSYSEYASPIVAVLKKNNDVRICGDYSATINKDLLIDSYPLPTINELCVSLHGCRFFSKIDLSNSYNQFLLDEKSQEYTCINTHKGLFKYTRLVFGLSNAPALFQRAMVQLLRMEGVEVFLDDVLVAAPTPQLHWRRVEAVLQRLQDAGLMLQKSKCSFFQKQVEYLGYVIDGDGIHKNPEKVKAILEAKAPENPKQLKSFLGIINFYRSFIPRASAVLEPLHSLLRKDVAWEWNPSHQEAFDAIKRELSSSRVLAHYDPRLELVLTVDAAPGGLGAVLAARYYDGTERPIGYASRSLCKSERAYSQIQKEATAIIFGIKRFHQYLYGRQTPFILRTDHKPLMSIFSPDRGISQMTEARLQRYALFLAAYNYKIEFVNSERNVADYLSRCPVAAGDTITDGTDVPSYMNALSAAGAPLPASPRELSSATANDEILSKVLIYVTKGWPRRVRAELLAYRRCQHELHVDEGVLMRGHRVVVPTVYRASVLQELHAAHLGIIKMKMIARERLWFPGIDVEIERVASTCERCIAARASPPKVPIENWHWPNSVFERIHIDYLGPVHNKVFLVLVDAYSKWLECIEVSNLSAVTLINKLQSVFTRFGLPKSIVSDNAKTFVSAEFSTFCKNNGIKQIFAPVYSPQSNGLAENAVKTCKKFIINALKDGSSKDMTTRLDEYLFHYRNSPHCTTELSPARLMFGRNLRCKLDLVSTPLRDGPPRQDIGETADVVCANQARQKRYFKGKNKFLNVRDSVWVKDYRGNPQKPTWVLGTIVTRVGKVLYDVAVNNSEIVWRRHANQLMKAYGGKVPETGSSYENWTYDKYDFGTDSNSVPNAELSRGTPPPREPPACGSEGGVREDPAECYGTPSSDSSSNQHNEPCQSHNKAATKIRTRYGRNIVPPKRLF